MSLLRQRPIPIGDIGTQGGPSVAHAIAFARIAAASVRRRRGPFNPYIAPTTDSIARAGTERLQGGRCASGCGFGDRHAADIGARRRCWRRVAANRGVDTARPDEPQLVSESGTIF